MGDVKQTNFRINADTADAFRSFCESRGFNQAQGFDHLMQVLELDRAKAEVPGRATEVSDFESHVKAILASYIQSVALAEATEMRIRDEYARRLESKDDTILDLQTELKEAKDTIEARAGTEARLLALQKDLAQVQADNRELVESKQLLELQCSRREADKQKIVDMLTSKLTIAEQKAMDYDALAFERDKLAKELQDIRADVREQARNAEIEAERAARAAEKALEAAVATAKAQGDAQVSKLKDDLREAKIKAAEDLRVAEERAHEADRIAASDIRKLEQENAHLREQLAELRARIPNN